jgi:hypothetical protein
MIRSRYLPSATTAVLALLLTAAPAAAGDFFSVTVSDGGFGISFGSVDWGVYGAAWNDPGWRVDYEVALSGYGQWIHVVGLGRVWRPWVAPGWQPYHYGRWVRTTYGWTWVAYEPWGYFPHHFGHWAYTSYGWVWLPGTTYHPARVTWVYSGGYVGWYPCPPTGWSHWAHGPHNVYRRGYDSGYDSGYRDGWRDASYATFVRWEHLSSADVSRRAVAVSMVEASAAAPRTSQHPPTRVEVLRRGRTVVPEAAMSERTVRLGDRTIALARPEGVESTVRRHARATVERALPDAAQGRTGSVLGSEGASAATAARPTRGAADRSSSITGRQSRGATSGDRSAVPPPPAARRRSHDEAAGSTRAGVRTASDGVSAPTTGSRGPAPRRSPSNGEPVALRGSSRVRSALQPPATAHREGELQPSGPTGGGSGEARSLPGRRPIPQGSTATARMPRIPVPSAGASRGTTSWHEPEAAKQRQSRGPDGARSASRTSRRPEVPPQPSGPDPRAPSSSRSRVRR